MLPDHFTKMKSKLDPSESFQKIVTQQHVSVRKAVEDIFPGRSIETKLIGSHQKNTRIQPRENEKADIDIVVVLGVFDSWVYDGTGIFSDQALNVTNKILNSHGRYEKINTTKEDRIIEVEYKSGVNIELIPAYRDNIGKTQNGVSYESEEQGYWIPNKYGGWEHADYDSDAKHVTKQNEKSDGRLVPVIKMLKAIKNNHFSQMKSFHLEIVASGIIPLLVGEYKNEDIGLNYAGLIKNFFRYAGSGLDSAVQFPGSNSVPVYFSIQDRQKTKKMFDLLSKYCDKIHETKSQADQINMWRQLFGGYFPTTI